MIEEMIHMTKDGKLGIRIALSFYREKMPWVYDGGILLLNKIEGSRTPTAIKCHVYEFEERCQVSPRYSFNHPNTSRPPKEHFKIRLHLIRITSACNATMP